MVKRKRRLKKWFRNPAFSFTTLGPGRFNSSTFNEQWPRTFGTASGALKWTPWWIDAPNIVRAASASLMKNVFLLLSNKIKITNDRDN